MQRAKILFSKTPEKRTLIYSVTFWHPQSLDKGGYKPITQPVPFFSPPICSIG